MECIFCDIIEGEIDSKKVYENENFVAFLDVNPASEGHTLVVPKNHIQEITDLSEKEAGNIFRVVKRVSKAVEKSLDPNGINIFQSNGEEAGQEIPHVHVHIVPRYKGDDIDINFRPGDLKKGEEIKKKIKSEM